MSARVAAAATPAHNKLAPGGVGYSYARVVVCNASPPPPPSLRLILSKFLFCSKRCCGSGEATSRMEAKGYNVAGVRRRQTVVVGGFSAVWSGLSASIGSLLFPPVCNSRDHIERLSHHIMMGWGWDGRNNGLRLSLLSPAFIPGEEGKGEGKGRKRDNYLDSTCFAGSGELSVCKVPAFLHRIRLR